MRAFYASLPRVKRFKLEAALVATVLVWGANFSIFKVALRHLHPHAANALRFVVALVVLGAAYFVWRRGSLSALRALFRRFGWKLFGMSLLGYGLYQFFFVVGLYNTSAGSAALIMASAPLWTALTGVLLRVERLTGAAWAGLLLSLAGALIVILGSTHVAVRVDTLEGNLFMLSAAVAWALYTTLSKPMLQHVEPTTLVFVEMAMAYPLLLALGLPYLFSTDWAAVTWMDAGALVFSGALSVGLTIIVWNSAVKAVGPSSTAAFNNLVPFVAVVFGLVVLGEPITRWQLAGGVLLISGLVWMRRARRRALTG